MKHLISAILAITMLCALLPMALSVSAAALPDNTVVVAASLTGASGSSADVKIGDTTYSVSIGTTGFAKLSEALEAVPAGGTILLAAGTYSEQVTITKDVTILGPKAGIDPNVRGASVTDDWTRNPARGTDEAVLTASWHVGINAPNKQVYDCHNVTIDGIAISGAGMLRSNYGADGSITLNYKNILVTGYTTSNNGPFYCYSYYPDKATNNYSRTLNAQNIRFEKLTTAPGFNLTVDKMDASGIYFDSASTGKMFNFLTLSTKAQAGGSVDITVRDSMFRQKTNQVLNCNLTTDSGGHKFNSNIAKCGKVTVNIENNVFANNDSSAATNNNIIVPQIKTDNVFFNIKNNVFTQSGTASANYIAIHGATDARALGEKFVIEGNKFMGIPTALSIPNSTTPFDLTGNYFVTADGKPAKPVVTGPDKTEWWYMDADMKTKSSDFADKLDGVPNVGTVSTDAKTLHDKVNTDSYKVTIDTASYNEVYLFADKELTKPLSNPVKLYSTTNTFYIKITSANRENFHVYTATVETTAPDKLSFDPATELRWFGRTYAQDGAYFFNWSASGFEFSFKGSGATATIASNAPGGNNTAYIKIFVDGVEQPDVALTKTSQTVTLAKDLDPGAEHTVKVVKRTNARSSSAALVSLSLTDGQKLAPPAAPTRLIEFIGDSITVGYATVANGKTTWGTDTEDVTKTYVTQIAEAFGADAMVTAISGRGVVRNTGGDTDKLLPAIYGYLDQYNNPGVEYDFALRPDVIVINLGTNDASGNNSSLTAAEFREGLKAFLKDVRAKNPKAEIIYTYGMMTVKYIKDMQAIVEELQNEGDSHIRFVKLQACGTNERAINHPTAEAYVSRGVVLIEQIAAATGWVAGEKPAEDTTPAETTPAQPSETTPALAQPNETTPATPAETTPADTEKDGGCGSAALPLATLGVAMAAGAVIAKKKKEN